MKTHLFLALSVAVSLGIYAAEPTALSVWAPPPLAKVLRDAVPPSEGPGPLIIEGARNETASAQAAVRPAADVAAARASISDLVHRKTGAVIPADAFSEPDADSYTQPDADSYAEPHAYAPSEPDAHTGPRFLGGIGQPACA